ncbi:hypothetical protein U1Q18_036028, partial [Sarracenia purpurea var. burkii]
MDSAAEDPVAEDPIVEDPTVRVASYGAGPSSATVQGKSSGTPELASFHAML